MRFEIIKLDPNMHGPEEFAVLSEAGLIALGYVWVFYGFNGAGENVRVGCSKLATEAEVLAYLESGLTRTEWEARTAD